MPYVARGATSVSGRMKPVKPLVRWTGGRGSMTLRAARELRETIPGLSWVNVTTYGDSENMVVITSPRCGYCGTYSPAARCGACGASVVRDGDYRG